MWLENVVIEYVQEDCKQIKQMMSSFISCNEQQEDKQSRGLQQLHVVSYRVYLLISAWQSSLWASIFMFITPGTCRKSWPNVLFLKERMQEVPVKASGTKKCLLTSSSENCLYLLNHGHLLPHHCSSLAMVRRGSMNSGQRGQGCLLCK